MEVRLILELVKSNGNCRIIQSAFAIRQCKALSEEVGEEIMTPKSDEGLVLEYLEDLTFYDENFVYGKRVDRKYQDIAHIKYTATAIKRSINFVPTGTSYETFLCLYFTDGTNITIEQERSFFGFKEKERAESVMKAAAIFGEITFTHRMEGYEKQLNEKGFITWSDYQFRKNGDLFKKHEFLFNLKEANVSKVLNIFTFEADKKPTNFKESFVKFWKGSERVEISTDRDCFLYFMKNYLGYTWSNEKVKEKKRPRQYEFFEAILTLGAKLCKADGRIDVEEIQTFKRYFGIDEKSFPESSEIFTKAAKSSSGINEPAQKIYNLFGGQKEPLEHIIIGFLQIAAADGVITNSEKNLIQSVCNVFSFSSQEIERIFAIFDNIKQEKQYSPKGGYSSSVRIQYLRLLGLGATASQDEVKIAYRELVRKHHPDILLAQGLPMERIRDSEEILKAINSAYNWLCSQENASKKATA
jgi:DnaJ like chaperone protein